MYVCAQLDGLNCLEWVERAYLLPPLSLTDGALLGGAVFAVYLTSWGISVILRQVFNQW